MLNADAAAERADITAILGLGSSPDLGPHTANVFGHPEAVTFPYHYPEIGTSLNVLHGLLGWESTLVCALCGLVDRGWLSESRAAKVLEWLERQGGPPPAEDLGGTDRPPLSVLPCPRA